MTLIEERSQQAVILRPSTMFSVIVYNLYLPNDKARF